MGKPAEGKRTGFGRITIISYVELIGYYRGDKRNKSYLRPRKQNNV
jgi:hypothetical protein